MDFIKNNIVVVRGGGDIATGTIHRLHNCGFPVLVLETQRPSSIRRKVSFSEAIYDGEITIEQIRAKYVKTIDDAKLCFKENIIPVMIDETADVIEQVQPKVLVDAILAKRNLGTNRGMADITIALGPGFSAGEDVDAVVETMRGHNLGRIIYDGAAMDNTGVPGNIGGFTKERVIYSPAAGTIKNKHQIGDLVEQGEILAHVGDTPILASISGVLRGIIRDGYSVTTGFKIADIDPRYSEKENCFTISDKARCIAGSVLEAVFFLNNKR